ncbi:MAG: hypothetical protein LQ340_002325 [Diploschistes diacapsis]|nr:MAG: hypothetical protein LQ340_002325 [Diploschistes diacapsis]
MADRSASVNAGVRNIRAMFEAKNEQASPPSRGRSPAAGSESIRSSSSRPMSKVRSSFIAVQEKSGHFGPILGMRKTSEFGDAASSAGKIKEGEIGGQENHAESLQTTESAIEEEERELPNKDKVKPSETGKEQKPESKDPAEPTPQGSLKDTSKDLEAAKANGLVSHISNSNARASFGANPEASKGQKLSKKPSRPSLPIGSTKPEAKGKPNASKTPTSASSSVAKKPTSKPAPLQQNLSRTGSTSKSKVSFPRISSPKSGGSPATIPKKAPKENQLPKPKPKSPIKPTVPKTSDKDFLSRMMRPTASSSSKTHESQLSSSGGKASSSADRSAPRTSTSGKRISDADSDLLSRMMRPTNSSASKFHDTDSKDTKHVASVSKSHRPTTQPAEGGFMDRMMRPTASSTSKTHHDAGTKGKGKRPSSASGSASGSGAAGQGHRPTTTPAAGGFLDRMMKPTTSSASKTHDKPSLTNSPPRKTEAAAAKAKKKISLGPEMKKGEEKTARASESLKPASKKEVPTKEEAKPKTMPSKEDLLASAAAEEGRTESAKEGLPASTDGRVSPTDSTKEGGNTEEAALEPAEEKEHTQETAPESKPEAKEFNTISLAAAAQAASISNEEANASSPTTSKMEAMFSQDKVLAPKESPPAPPPTREGDGEGNEGASGKLDILAGTTEESEGVIDEGEVSQASETDQPDLNHHEQANGHDEVQSEPGMEGEEKTLPEETQEGSKEDAEAESEGGKAEEVNAEDNHADAAHTEEGGLLGESSTHVLNPRSP